MDVEKIQIIPLISSSTVRGRETQEKNMFDACKKTTKLRTLFWNDEDKCRLKSQNHKRKVRITYQLIIWENRLKIDRNTVVKLGEEKKAVNLKKK